MTGQPALFATAEPLTPRQQAVLDLVNAHPDGVTADEAGATAHTIPGPRGGRTHTEDARCDWCAKEGKRILEQLIDRGHVRRRRTREPGQRGYLYAPTSPGARAETLPGPGDLPAGF